MIDKVEPVRVSYANGKEIPELWARLTFHRRELLYDIANYAYIEGQPMEAGAMYVQDIVEDGNADRAARMMNIAFSECEEALYPFTLLPIVEGEERDDTLSQDHEYIVELRLPKTFAKSTLTLLERYIHEYIVCRVLRDWLAITKPEAAATWATKAQEAREGIARALTERTGRLRRTQTPF